MKFTQTNVRKLSAPAGKNDVTICDEAMPGFGIRFRNQGAGVYVIQYSVDGKQAKMALGAVAKVTLDDAQTEAKKHFALIAQKVDPLAERAKEAVKKGSNFGERIEDYFKHLEALDRTPHYIDDNRRCLQRYMTALHRFGIGEITRALIAGELNKIKSNNGPRQSGLARSYIHTFYCWAMTQGLCEANPAMGTEKNKSGRRDRVLEPAEIVAIWNATDSDDHFDKIARLLILTAARISQIGSLSRVELNLKDGIIDLPAVAGRSKNKERFLIALSRRASAILESVPARVGSDFVFGEGEGGFSGWSKSKQRLDEKLGDKVKPWVFHDFRRTFDSLGQDVCKIPPHVADVCLNHVGEARKGVKRHYNHATYLDEKRDAMQKWADYIEKLVHGERKLAAV
jgi:integrase